MEQLTILKSLDGNTLDFTLDMTKKDFEIITHSPEQTQQLGSVLGRLVNTSDMIFLVGNLGAGKTCFTQGFAWGTGFDGYASSPSFVLVREYDGRLKVYHIDFYRLDNTDEITELGIDDMMEEGVCVIEWADKALDLLPEEHLLITFEHLSENERCLCFKPYGKRYRYIAEQLKEKWNSR